MRKYLIILFLLISTLAEATTYYVATDGLDSNPGTLAQPWLTWGKGFSTAIAGDTVFFRGGVYYTTSIISSSNSGTFSNPIVFMNYLNEVPILDGINKTSPTSGIQLSNKQYLHLIGLTIRNNKQITVDYKFTSGFVFYLGCKVTLRECVSYNNGIRGFWFRDIDTSYVYDCDAYNNADSLTASPETGNNGDGFMVSALDNATDGYIIFRGCRSWHNSDDGFDVNHEGYVEIDSCWTWANGYLEAGNGCGYKLALSSNVVTALSRRLTNSITAYNKFDGITTNDRNFVAYTMQVYNNTSYNNDHYGVYIYNSSSSDVQELTRTFKNNISYANTTGSAGTGTGALYTHTNNTWDIPITLTDADFVSVDSAGISGARQADGSPPALTFLTLSNVSQAIDQGVDVGIAYEGDAPDLGAYEFNDYVAPPTVPLISTIYPYAVGSVAAYSGGYLIDDGGGTISAKGICWGTSVDPDLTDNVISGGTGAADFTCHIRGLTPNTTYHVRAYATNETGTTYGADVEFTTSVSSYVHDAAGILVKSGGKIVIN